MLGIGDLPIAERSISELSEFDRRIAEFNRKRLPTKPASGSRIISWSDPVTARGLFDDDAVDKRSGNGGIGLASSPLGKFDSASTEDHPYALFNEEMEEVGIGMRQRRLRGRRSFDDVEKLKGTRVLPLDRMRIDVELCGQLLIMNRREAHLVNVIACLRALTSSLSQTNTALRSDYTDHENELKGLEGRMGILQEIEEARGETEGMTQETNALAYESAQFLVDDLWHMASQPRRKVLDHRAKVFGTGRRLRQGVHGAHGQFNRVQWRVDGTEVLVDAWGRTESEAEEEEGLPGGRPVLEEEEEGEIVEHPSLRPTWLLRFFNSWGSRSGFTATGKDISPNRQPSVGGPSSSSSSSSRERGAATEVQEEEGMSSSVEGQLGEKRTSFITPTEEI